MDFSQRLKKEVAIVNSKLEMDKDYVKKLKIRYAKPTSSSKDYAEVGQTLEFPTSIDPSKGTVQMLTIDGTDVSFDVFLVKDVKTNTMKYLTFSKLYRSVVDAVGNEVSPVTMLKEYNKENKDKPIEEDKLAYTLWNKMFVPEDFFKAVEGKTVEWLDTKEVECVSKSTGETYTTEVSLIVFKD